MNYNKITKYYLWYTGEAAGIAMGLVMVGTRSSSAISDLLTVSPIQYLVVHMYHCNFHSTAECLPPLLFSMLEKLSMKRYNVD